MARDLSYEDPKATFLITSRTISSRLWFVNNRTLERKITAFLAKYKKRYGLIIYAFIIMGNHIHLVARFPNGNKAAFLNAFNSIIAKLVQKNVKEFGDGPLWGGRARCQLLPEAADIENAVLYLALNPVSSGLCQKYTSYRTFNSISAAIMGKTLSFEIVDWTAFNNLKRVNPNANPKDYTEIYTLSFDRIPGYEHLSHKQYLQMMEEKIEKRRVEVIRKRLEEGKGFAGEEALLKTEPGAFPHSTKKAERHTKRPLVLTRSDETRRIHLDIYFRRLEAYKIASKRFREGDLTVEFPPGTYRPPLRVPI